MLIITIKEGENIDRALKRYKRKVKNTKQIQEIRKRKEFNKASVVKRELLKKAKYKQQYVLKIEK